MIPNIGKIEIIKNHPRKWLTIFNAEVNGIKLNRLRLVDRETLMIPKIGNQPYCELSEEIKFYLIKNVEEASLAHLCNLQAENS